MKLFPFDVFFNPKSMANILSLAEVSSVFRVNMDTAEELAMTVHIGDGVSLKFSKCESGLYYFDTSKSSNSTIMAYSFLSTVKKRKKFKERIEHVYYKATLHGHPPGI